MIVRKLPAKFRDGYKPLTDEVEVRLLRRADLGETPFMICSGTYVHDYSSGVAEKRVRDIFRRGNWHDINGRFVLSYDMWCIVPKGQFEAESNEWGEISP